jgi:hypothetical protein
VQIGFIWLMTETSCEHGNETSGSVKAGTC